MAKKRLNKKVAIIGLVFLLLFVVGVIVLVGHFTQDPQKFFDDAKAAMQTKDYETALRNYGQALRFTKNKQLRIEIYLELANLYVEMNDWNKAAGYWNRIITIDTQNSKARTALLGFFYEAADSGAWNHWKNVESNASELIEIEPSPYAYLARGRAAFEIAKLGQTSDRQTKIRQAIDYLKEAIKHDSENVDLYLYLAQAQITEGEIIAATGDLAAEENSLENAEQTLMHGIEILPQESRTYIALLDIKSLAIAKKSVEAFEAEYIALTEKFPSSPHVFSSLAGYYQTKITDTEKAIEAAKKAVQLDPENVEYAGSLARLYYRQYCFAKQKNAAKSAIEIAKNALTLPAAQDTKGPRQWESRLYRHTLYNIIALSYLNQILNPDIVISEEEKQEYITKVEKTIHEIQQILGSEENPYSIMWDGLLALAKEDTVTATRKMYTAYEQLVVIRNTRTRNLELAELSYRLALIFKDSVETGAYLQFLTSSIRSGMILLRPEVLLDFADIILDLGNPTHAVTLVNNFEESLNPTQRSKLLRIHAYINARAFDQAETSIQKLDPADVNTINAKYVLAYTKVKQIAKTLAEKQLEQDIPKIIESDIQLPTPEGSVEAMKTELDSLRSTQLALAKQILQKNPDFIKPSDVAILCQGYITERQFQKAKNVTELYLQYFPSNTTALVYKQVLLEPEPTNISTERRNEISVQVLTEISDPLARTITLGEFYIDIVQNEKALEELKKAMEIEPSNQQAISAAFQLAIGSDNLEYAKQLVEIARQNNTDECQGQLFSARLAMQNQEYETALEDLDDCLKQRPVFSVAYKFRSLIYDAMNKPQAALEDIRKAEKLNLLDEGIAKHLAYLLYKRDQRLGDKVATEQLIETKEALQKAISLAPRDTRLLSFYAEYISDEQPSKALALRQYLQKVIPSVENAVLLGNLAIKISPEQINTERKQALINIAESAFEQAYQMDPLNNIVLNAYSEFYRKTGQYEKAKRLLQESTDKNLMWDYYLKQGQTKEAKKILDELYKADPKNTILVRGLLGVAQATADQNDILTYSKELLSLENTVENQILQITLFLESGIITQAEDKLLSFREKYPYDTRAMLLEASVTAKKGQLDKALELTNRCLELEQENARAWRLRGQINYLSGNYEQALMDLQDSKTIETTPATRLDLAKAYLRLGRKEDAMTELVFAVEGDSPPAGARKLLEYVCMQLNRVTRLNKFYEDTLTKLPNDVYWHKQAAAFALSGGDLDRATELYKTAWQNSQVDGGNLGALDGYLKMLLIGQKHDQLLKYASEYLDGDFAPVAFARIADVKLGLGDKEACIEFYHKALDKAGEDEETILKLLKRIAGALGHLEAKKWCHEKLAINPKSLSANFAMAKMLQSTGDYHKSIDHLDKCLEILDSNNPKRYNAKSNKAELLYLLYSKTAERKYLDMVIAEYEDILERWPTNTTVLNNLSYMLLENDQSLEKALQYADRARKQLPNNPDMLETYGYALYKNEQYKKAAEYLQMSIQLFEQNKTVAPIEAYEHLGMAYEKLEQNRRSLVAYKTASGLAKNQPEVNERLKKAIERVSNLLEAKVYGDPNSTL